MRGASSFLTVRRLLVMLGVMTVVSVVSLAYAFHADRQWREVKEFSHELKEWNEHLTLREERVQAQENAYRNAVGHGSNTIRIETTAAATAHSLNVTFTSNQDINASLQYRPVGEERWGERLLGPSLVRSGSFTVTKNVQPGQTYEYRVVGQAHTLTQPQTIVVPKGDSTL